jgi:hypothetical protein
MKCSRCASVAAALVAAACTAPIQESNDTITRVDVTPFEVTLAVGGSRQLAAVAIDGRGHEVTVESFTWSTSDATIASVTQTGLATAVAAGSAAISASAGGVTGQTRVVVTPSELSGQVIEVWPTITYQTILGWEATTQVGQLECDRQTYLRYHDALMDRGVNELGLNRLRLQAKSGIENSVDYFTPYKDGLADRPSWRAHWWDIINDNNDPFTINPNGFQFAVLDYDVEQVVLPMRARLAARGEQLYVNLNYVDFGASGFEHSTNPEEYAEYMLATFQHLKTKYNLVPDAIELILEPDNTQNWRPTTMARALVAAGDRLKAAGFTPAFIAPSNTDASRALQWIDSLVAQPRVLEYLQEFSYHRYGGASDQVVSSIGARAVQYQRGSSMLEHIGSDYNDLHTDLSLGRNTAWQQFGFGYCGTIDDGGIYYLIDPATAANPQINLTSRARLLRQYFLFVRRGAVRVGAGTGDTRFNPLAFRNTTGKFVVIVKSSGGGNFSVRGLPAGTYGLKFATSSAYDQNLPDVTISPGQSVPASIPASGVITIYQR